MSPDKRRICKTMFAPSKNRVALILILPLLTVAAAATFVWWYSTRIKIEPSRHGA
jgi:hypothetical protein